MMNISLDQGTNDHKENDCYLVIPDSDTESSLLNDYLKYFSKNRNKFIKDLTKEEQSKFNQITNLISYTYETENYYQVNSLIKSIFSDLDNVIPGTIGAYFLGCLSQSPLTVNSNPSKTSCSNLKVDNIEVHSNNNKNWDLCNQTVFWYKDDDLLILNKIKDSTKTLLFTNYSNYNMFPGLSENQRKILSDHNVREIMIVGCIKEKEYVELTSWIYLENVKSKVTFNPLISQIPLTENNTHNYDVNTGLFILITTVILVIILLLWKIFNKKSKSGTKVKNKSRRYFNT